MSLFFPGYFLVASLVRLILKNGKGGLENGPIINAFLTSFFQECVAVNLWHVLVNLGIAFKPGWKSWVESQLRKLINW